MQMVSVGTHTQKPQFNQPTLLIECGKRLFMDPSVQFHSLSLYLIKLLQLFFWCKLCWVARWVSRGIPLLPPFTINFFW